MGTKAENPFLTTWCRFINDHSVSLSSSIVTVEFHRFLVFFPPANTFLGPELERQFFLFASSLAKVQFGMWAELVEVTLDFASQLVLCWDHFSYIVPDVNFC